MRMSLSVVLLSSHVAALVTGGARDARGAAGTLSRRQALGAAVLLPFAPAACLAAPAATTGGVGITVIKSGTGGTPTKGDLCAIRFKGSVKATGAVFDDIMASVEPYYFRVGKCALPLRAWVCVCVCLCMCVRGGRDRLRVPYRAGGDCPALGTAHHGTRVAGPGRDQLTRLTWLAHRAQ